MTLPDCYFLVEFCQNFYIYLCRKGGAFYVSILVKIGRIFFILSSKNHENRSDLSLRPVFIKKHAFTDVKNCKQPWVKNHAEKRFYGLSFACFLYNCFQEGLKVTCSKNCGISSTECYMKQEIQIVPICL